MDILFKLLLAHFLCDFLLQWRHLLENKENRKFFSPYLYLHGVIHYLVSLALVWDLSWWFPLAVIAGSHTFIDGCKVSFSNAKNDRLLFFLDQFAHLLILVGVWAFMTSTHVDIVSSIPFFWAHLTALFFVLFPSSIIIQKIFSKWPLPQSEQEDMKGVGAYVGYIERILIYIAVVTNHWSLIGFLLAAKSVYRFSEANSQTGRRLGEYWFLGSVLSVLMAVLSGLLFLSLTGQPIAA